MSYASRWPTAAHFATILQHPKLAFRGPELQQVVIEKDPRYPNQPRVWAGAFANVYRANYPDGKVRAIRVFTSAVAEREDRYRMVAQHIEKLRLNSLVPFEYSPKGIRSAGDGKWYPLVTMDWVSGETLYEWARKKCLHRNRQALRQASDLWVEVVRELKNANIAHGDLEHSNVLVTSAGPLKLKLVDYDCMCVPPLVGRRNLEIGVEPYQHPNRNWDTRLNRNLDNFSALVILVALRALAEAPELWDTYVERPQYDKLLFRREDFAAPQSSNLIQTLQRLPDREVQRLCKALVESLQREIDGVPTLGEVLSSVRFRPEDLKQLLDARKYDEALDYLEGANKQITDVKGRALQARVHDAKKRVDCRLELEQAVAAGDERAMQRLCRSKLLENYPKAEQAVHFAAQAYQVNSVLLQLQIARRARSSRQLVRIWDANQSLLVGRKSAEPFAAEVRRCRERNQACDKAIGEFRRIRQQPGDVRALEAAIKRLEDLGGHPDFEPHRAEAAKLRQQGRAWSRIVRRHTNIDFPATVREGEPCDLRVQIVPAEDRLPTGETRELPKRHDYDVTMPLQAPEPSGPDQLPPLRVVVSVAAENFDIDGPNRAELVVPVEGKSYIVVFPLVGQTVGPGRIMVDFSQDGRLVGSVDLWPEVVAADQPRADQPLPGEGEVHLSPFPAVPPDLIIKVFVHRYAGSPGQLRFVLSSVHPKLQDLPVLDGDVGTLDLHNDVTNWVESQMAPLTGLAQRDNVNPEDAEKTMHRIGWNLYDQLIPEKLKDLYWVFRQRGIFTLMIVSDDPHIPWELIRAYRVDPMTSQHKKDEPFWGEVFAMTHWLRPQPPTRSLPLKRVFVVAPGSGEPPAAGQTGSRPMVTVDPSPESTSGSPDPFPDPRVPSAEEELAVLRRLEAAGARVALLPGRRRDLQEVLEQDFDLLHLACHGQFGGVSTADASVVQMEDGTFSVAELAEPSAAALRRNHPLIFFNACQSGRTGFALTRLGSWSAKFVALGCGGFIGTLWVVRDNSALAFAEAFYDRLSQGVPIGEAMLRARLQIRDNFPDDPTWLAYCCFADPMARLGGAAEETRKAKAWQE